MNPILPLAMQDGGCWAGKKVSGPKYEVSGDSEKADWDSTLEDPQLTQWPAVLLSANYLTSLLLPPFTYRNGHHNPYPGKVIGKTEINSPWERSCYTLERKQMEVSSVPVQNSQPRLYSVHSASQIAKESLLLSQIPWPRGTGSVLISSDGGNETASLSGMEMSLEGPRHCLELNPDHFLKFPLLLRLDPRWEPC